MPPGPAGEAVNDNFPPRETLQAAMAGNLAAAVDLLVDRCHGASVAGGWWVGPHPTDCGPRATDNYLEHVRSNTRFGKALSAEKISLIHSEVSEALEGLRKGKADEHCPEFSSEEVEMADALIRIFDYAGARRLRLGAALVAKMAYNEVREDHKPESRAAAGGKAF